MSKHIVVLGGGYGGLLSALSAREHFTEAEATITLVNKIPYHQIVTELHRLAAGTVSEKAVALPLEKLLRGKSITLKIATAKEISPDNHLVTLEDGSTLQYDLLVAALGSETAFFGIPGLQEHSFVLKSVQDANRVRAHIEACIQEYKQTKNKAAATIVIGGGGLTGIELVGEVADILPELCRKYAVDRNEIALINVEAAPTILPGFPQDLIDRAKSSLEARGVQFLTGLAITQMDGTTVHLKDESTLETKTLIWTGGVQGNSVVANSGIAVNRGRATVNEYLQSTSHPDVFLAGDCAVVFAPGSERPYPPTAQISWQMGETVGYNMYAFVNKSTMQEFSPVFSGTLASLGRKDAIGTIGANQTKLKGMPASFMKEASNIRYLSHIKGLFSLAY